MDPTFVALIVPVWNWLAAGQNAVLFGIVIAGFANVVVLLIWRNCSLCITTTYRR